MSISAIYPAIRPSLNLDFANVGRLDPRVTFTRASTARYYDGVTTTKAEQNLLVQSQDFTTTWINSNTTDTANTETAPDGTSTADTITDDATNNIHVIRQVTSVLPTTTYVFSCFLKAGTNNHAYLSIYDAAASQRNFYADFDLSGGTVRVDGNGTSGTLTSSSITSVGNSWYRCVIVGEIATAGTNMQAAIGLSDGTTGFTTFGSIAYAGTGSTIYAWGAQLEQRSAVTAYTATTTQPITNYVPVLLTAQNNEARFDHNPTTGAALGLEIEEQRTNLVTYSDDFANAAWTKTNSSITSNTIVAPDGTLTGDKLVENTTTSSKSVVRTVSVTAQTYTYSVFAKAGERSILQINLPDPGAGGAGKVGSFNLSTGQLGVVQDSGVTRTIEDVGNGVYRCSITVSLTGSGNINIGIFVTQSDIRVQSYTGDGYSGIYIWGAQLEAGAFATSYIPTTTTALTRSADAASMTGTNFSDWFNAAEGTLYSDWQVPNATASCSIVSISDGTTNNRFQQYSELSGITVRTSASGVSANNAVGTSAANTAFRVAFGYGSGTTSASDNGSAISTTTQTLPTTLTTLYIGAGANGTIGKASTIRKIAYYPVRVSDAQLQALTG